MVDMATILIMPLTVLAIFYPGHALLLLILAAGKPSLMTVRIMTLRKILTLLLKALTLLDCATILLLLVAGR
jgi:hypothetical protein